MDVWSVCHRLDDPVRGHDPITLEYRSEKLDCALGLSGRWHKRVWLNVSAQTCLAWWQATAYRVVNSERGAT